MNDFAQRGSPRETVLQGDIRAAVLWEGFQRTLAHAQRSGSEADIAQAKSAWESWLQTYIPDPSERLAVPRPIIGLRGH